MFDINDNIVDITSDDDRIPKMGELRPKEKYDNTVIDMKEATSQTLDVVYQIDMDVEGLNAYNAEKNSIFRQALAAFLTKDWEQAVQLFKKLPEDPMSKKYIEYIDIVKSPAEEWDGSYDASKYLLLDEKQ